MKEVFRNSLEEPTTIEANKTLIIDQYTWYAGEEPELFQYATSMQEVFRHFKPKVDVEFENEKGEIIIETIQFNDVSDFETEGGNGALIRNSKFLSQTKKHHDDYSREVGRLRRIIDELSAIPVDLGTTDDLKSSINLLQNQLDFYESQELEYQYLLEKNITTVLKCIGTMETSYRTLDLFYKNAKSDDVKNLRLVNVNRDSICNLSYVFLEQIDFLLRDSFDRLNADENYSMIVLPGYVIQDKESLIRWAHLVQKYKVMIFTDCEKADNYEDLRCFCSNYKDSDEELQNIVVTCNWIVGRQSEKLSLEEQLLQAFYIPPSAALAGNLYGMGMKKYVSGIIPHGHLEGVDDVEISLVKHQVAELMDCNVVPMVSVGGCVKPFGGSTLYCGFVGWMQEYSIVRLFNMIGRFLMSIVQKATFEYWNPYESPNCLNQEIRHFLDNFREYGSLLQNYRLSTPIQDSETKEVTVIVEVVPYISKSFSFIIKANKEVKRFEIGQV